MSYTYHNGCDEGNNFVQRFQEAFQSFRRQEVGGGLHHVRRVGGIMVRIRSVIIRFDKCQPISKRSFVRLQNLGDAESRKYCHSEPHERSENRNRKHKFLLYNKAILWTTTFWFFEWGEKLVEFLSVKN